MNNLTPVFEREAGLVILEGIPAGVAGEAPLIPVAGLELAFDRDDGRLCRAEIDTAADDGSVAGSAEAMLKRLFGAQALSALTGSGAPAGQIPVLSADPELTATLSSLARLDAARATSPVAPDSPWWAAEAAVLAERCGLHTRARVEAHQALVKLLGQLDGLRALPAEAIRAALAVASIYADIDPGAATKLREALKKLASRNPDGESPATAGFDVAAEVESLQKSSVHLSALHWMLDPHLLPEGLFRPGLSPHSDLSVRQDGPNGRVIVQAVLSSGAAYQAASRCVARLVDPVRRHVLTQAPFTKTTDSGDQAGVRAKLELDHPLDEGQEAWIEVVQDKHYPVRSAKGHRIRRALRWADTALRAERAPAGLAPHSMPKDWTALAAEAWDHCRRDWEAAGDPCNAALAAQRHQAVLDAPPHAPQPAGTDPVYLAEVLGR